MSEIDKALWQLHTAMQASDRSLQTLKQRAAQLKDHFDPVAVARRDFNNWTKSSAGKAFKAGLFEQQQGRCVGAECKARSPLGSEYLEIDHIQPLSKYPQLALDPQNLQLLCGPCNKKKSASI